MALSKLQAGVISAVIIAGATIPIVWQHRANAALRAQTVELQRQLAELARQTSEKPVVTTLEDEQARVEHAELVRLRGEVAAHRRDAQELAQARTEIARLQAQMQSPAAAKPNDRVLAEGLVPALSWKNAGVNTPAEAYETMLWAKNYGQVQTFVKTFVLDDLGQAKADALYATIPESLRAKYASPEEMMAGLLINTTAVAGMRVVDQSSEDTEDTKLNVQYQYSDGRVREDTVDLHRYPDGWRQIIAAGIVDKLGRNLNEILAARTK